MPNNIYRNSEGYYDPTAGAVLAKCDRKEKSDRRKGHPQGERKGKKTGCCGKALHHLYLQPLCRGYRKKHPRSTEILQICGRQRIPALRGEPVLSAVLK